MRSPCVLTLLLVAASSINCRHVLYKPYSKHDLVERIAPEARPGEEPGRGEPERPRPAIMPASEDFEHPESFRYVEVMDTKPKYKWKTVPENEAGVLKKLGTDHYGNNILQVEWQETGLASSTRELQTLVKGGSNLVRFNTPRSPAANVIQVRAAQAELATQLARTNAERNENIRKAMSEESYYKNSPLQELTDKFMRQSLEGKLVEVAGTSRIRQDLWNDEEDDSPLTVNFVDARVAPIRKLPFTPIAGTLNYETIVDKDGRLIDLPRQFFEEFEYDQNSFRRLHRRGSVLGDITNSPNSPNATLSSQAAQFQSYLLAYLSASANVSALLFPHLDSILQDTNSSLAYNMAFSLYADLTGAPLHVTSPFSNGLNCIDWIEQVWRNQSNNGTTTITYTSPANTTVDHATNTTVTGADIPMLEWLYAAKTLRPVYEEVWANVTKAANASLQDLATLSQWMNPSDRTVLTPGFTDTVNTTSRDMAYFTVRNETMGSNATTKR